jgi:multidrug efflux pump
MANFFIDRPIFAWVIALFILVLGGVSITQLPVAQYPPVAPPTIVVSAAYPGAAAQTLEDSVLAVIEREMNGAPGLIYMESVAQANGSGSLTLTSKAAPMPTWRRWRCRTAWRAPARACLPSSTSRVCAWKRRAATS